MQPKAVQETPLHRLHLRFRIHAACPLDGVMLAMEEPENAEIFFNGAHVPAEVCGWYADRSIRTLPLPPVPAGESVLEMTLPFGKSVTGTRRTLMPLPQRLGYDDITRQGLAHYSGELEYSFPVTCAGGTLCVHTPHFRAAYLEVCVDGGAPQLLMVPPYTARFDGVCAGAHTVAIRACIPRENTFRPFHNAETNVRKQAPESWRTRGDAWTESYRLSPEGLLSAPKIWTEEL